MTDGDVLVRYTGTGKVVSVPRGIRIIGPDAFLGNESLEAVILPDSVEEIGERAFGNCPKLKEVILSTDSLLKKIGSRAFLNCVKISRAFAENIEQVAADAFEGVPEETPVPVPTVPVTPEPQPTEDPWEEPDDPEDPYEDIEWEPLPVPGGGGGGGGKWQPHAKSRQTMTHDYDQVQLDGADQAEAMSILTLGDEQLQIGIAEGLFTVHLESGMRKPKRTIWCSQPWRRRTAAGKSTGPDCANWRKAALTVLSFSPAHIRSACPQKAIWRAGNMRN